MVIHSLSVIKKNVFSILKPVLLLTVFIFYSFSTTAQNKYSEELTDDELNKALKKELNSMVKRGATPKDVSDAFMRKDLEKYINSREEYYRFQLFTNYIREAYMEQKLSKGIVSEEDEKTSKKLLKKNKTYAEYLEFKKTGRAKEIWENSISDGVLKLVVNDIDKLSEEEQERLNGLNILLENDTSYKYIILASPNVDTIKKIELKTVVNKE